MILPFIRTEFTPRHGSASPLPSRKWSDESGTVVRANTKSEARARLKARLGLRRLPAGTLVTMLAALLIVAFPLAAPAAWGAGCGPVGPTTSPAAAWTQHPSDPDFWVWSAGGRVVAGYRQSTGQFYAFDGAAWTTAKTPWQPARKDAEENFGVDTSKLSHEECYRVGGRKITREQARALIGGGQLPDDSARLRLTVIGSDSERQAVLAAFAAEPLAKFRDSLLIQDYAPDHWAVARAGFVTDGHPTIYVQAPDGTVLTRQSVFAAGDLAAALDKAGAVRKPDPLYDPKKDPDLSKPFNLTWPHPALVCAALILALVLWRKNER